MKKTAILIICLLSLISLVKSESFSTITKSENLNVGKGNNYILMSDSILDCRFSNSNIKYQRIGDLLKFEVTEKFTPSSLLVICKNNKNYLLCLTANKGSNFHDLKKLPSTDNNKLELINMQLGDISIKRHYSTGAAKTLTQLNTSPLKSYVGSYFKHEKVGLILQNYEKNYQLKHYSFCIVNNSEEKFIPGLIKIKAINNGEAKQIFPERETELKTISEHSKACFSFALPKKFDQEFWVEIEDVKNPNRKLSLRIKAPVIKKGVVTES